VPAQQQPAPVDGPLLNVRAHHQAEGPALVMGALDGGIEQNLAAVIVQAQSDSMSSMQGWRDRCGGGGGSTGCGIG
jgi:hypothetical protein